MFQMILPGWAFLPLTWSCGPTVTAPDPMSQPVYPPSFHVRVPKSPV